MVEPPTPTSEPYLLDMPSTVERARMRRDATERVARDHADEATSLRIDLEEARLVQSWQGGRIDDLARELREVTARHRAAAEVATAGVEANGALGHLRGVFGMADDEPPLTALARIREEAAAVERARWCEALGLSSMDAAKAYIAKLDGELEGTGKPTPHQPAGGGGGGAGATVVMVGDAPKPAAEAATDGKGDGKRKATPRTDRVTTVELAKAVRAASDEAKATGGKIPDLALVFEPFVGRTVVKAKAKGAEHDVAAEVAAPVPTEPPQIDGGGAHGLVLSARADRFPLTWDEESTGINRLMLHPIGKLTACVLATVEAPPDSDVRRVESILGIVEVVDPPPIVGDRDFGVERAEALVVESMAGVIANLTGREVLLGDRRPRAGGADVGPG